MKILPPDLANRYLNSIGMQVGQWNELAMLNGVKSNWINYQAPKEAKALLVFSYHLAGWISTGGWKIFQIDNSTSLNSADQVLLNQLVCGAETPFDYLRNRTLFFEFDADQKNNPRQELVIASLIHFFLLTEGHGHLVSSGNEHKKHLSIQDGYAYFLSDKLEEPQALLDRFESAPLRYPEWAVSAILSGEDE